MPYKLKTDFKAPADTHTVLIVTAHYWGRGKTKDEAVAKTKSEGGDPGRNGYWAYYFGEGFKQDTGWVDQMGGIHWEVTDEMAQKPRSEWPTPVKEERLKKD